MTVEKQTGSWLVHRLNRPGTGASTAGEHGGLFSRHTAVLIFYDLKMYSAACSRFIKEKQYHVGVSDGHKEWTQMHNSHTNQVPDKQSFNRQASSAKTRK